MGHWSHVDCNIYDMFCVLLVLHVVCLCLGIAIVVVTSSMLWYFLQGTIKRKGTTTLPPGSSGLPFLGETLELFYASKANKVLEDFLNPRVAKYGQVHTLLITQISFKSLCFHSHKMFHNSKGVVTCVYDNPIVMSTKHYNMHFMLNIQVKCLSHV
jgi:hypothetical protein